MQGAPKLPGRDAGLLSERAALNGLRMAPGGMTGLLTLC